MNMTPAIDGTTPPARVIVPDPGADVDLDPPPWMDRRGDRTSTDVVPLPPAERRLVMPRRESLDAIAAEIGQVYGEVEAIEGRAEQDKAPRIMRIGALLTKARDQLDHGEFMKWITANRKFGPRQARNYLKVYAKTEPGAVLKSLKRERAALAKPRPKDDVASIAARHARRIARKIEDEGGDYYAFKAYIAALADALDKELSRMM
jgi:hypothetical protein